MKGKNFMALCSSWEGLSEQKQIDKIQGILGQRLDLQVKVYQLQRQREL